MREVVLGIDVGTSGVRIAARARDGSLLAMASAPMPAPISLQGRIQQDAEVWWQAVRSALLKIDLKNLVVRAIAVDGTSGTVLPITVDGTPLGLASLYNDVATPENVTVVEAVASQNTAALGATSPLARALEFSSGRIAHQADWIMGRLCGVYDVSDENNALKSGYDPVSRCWPSWIAETGLNITRLPKVVPVGTRVGVVRGEVAKEFSLPPDSAVVSGTTDGCAAFLASGASLAGDGVTSLGTTLTLKLLSDTPVFAPQFGIYSHRIGEMWLAGGASNSGGGVIAELFSPDEIVQFSALINVQQNTGLSYYPLRKAGERFPINDPNLPPRLSPIPLARSVFFQAVLEGIADIEALGYQRLAELGATPLNSLRSVGGGAGNQPWSEIRLNKLGVASHSPDSEHAAMGVARLAWWGIGHNDS